MSLQIVLIVLKSHTRSENLESIVSPFDPQSKTTSSDQFLAQSNNFEIFTFCEILIVLNVLKSHTRSENWESRVAPFAPQSKIISRDNFLASLNNFDF